jgi:hypothetical protein
MQAQEVKYNEEVLALACAFQYLTIASLFIIIMMIIIADISLLRYNV